MDKVSEFNRLANSFDASQLADSRYKIVEKGDQFELVKIESFFEWLGLYIASFIPLLRSRLNVWKAEEHYAQAVFTAGVGASIGIQEELHRLAIRQLGTSALGSASARVQRVSELSRATLSAQEAEKGLIGLSGSRLDSRKVSHEQVNESLGYAASTLELYSCFSKYRERLAIHVQEAAESLRAEFGQEIDEKATWDRKKWSLEAAIEHLMLEAVTRGVSDLEVGEGMSAEIFKERATVAVSSEAAKLRKLVEDVRVYGAGNPQVLATAWRELQEQQAWIEDAIFHSSQVLGQDHPIVKTLQELEEFLKAEEVAAKGAIQKLRNDAKDAHAALTCKYESNKAAYNAVLGDYLLGVSERADEVMTEPVMIINNAVRKAQDELKASGEFKGDIVDELRTLLRNPAGFYTFMKRCGASIDFGSLDPRTVTERQLRAHIDEYNKRVSAGSGEGSTGYFFGLLQPLFTAIENIERTGFETTPPAPNKDLLSGIVGPMMAVRDALIQAEVAAGGAEKLKAETRVYQERRLEYARAQKFCSIHSLDTPVAEVGQAVPASNETEEEIGRLERELHATKHALDSAALRLAATEAALVGIDAFVPAAAAA